MIFFFLCLVSVVEVFSASSELTYKGGSYLSPLIKHIGILVMGVFCMVVTLNVKCKYFKILTPFMLIISFFTLIWVFVAGQSTNGAQRWISFIGIQFQPSEIAKGTMVLATAQILSALQTDHGAQRLPPVGDGYCERGTDQARLQFIFGHEDFVYQCRQPDMRTDRRQRGESGRRNGAGFTDRP